MTVRILREILHRVDSWPEEDQAALAEFARELEAQRTGVYQLSDEERDAIRKAQQTDLLSEEQIDEYWKSHGIG
jgi:hypothetical protein